MNFLSGAYPWIKALHVISVIAWMAIVSPGFAADCLETLEELAIGLQESFREKGGTHFAYLPCLNDTPRGLDMLDQLVGQELAGWL